MLAVTLVPEQEFDKIRGVLLDRDLTTIEPETIRGTQVLNTIVGGRVVFCNQ